MNRYVILIGIGGLFGSIARYLAASFLTKTIPSAFPYGTFAVNIIGCLIIGIIFGLSARFGWFPEWRVFFGNRLLRRIYDVFIFRLRKYSSIAG